MSRVSLINPQEAQVETMATTPHPAACGANMAPWLSNVEPYGGTLIARAACTEVPQTAPAGLQSLLGSRVAPFVDEYGGKTGFKGAWSGGDGLYVAYGVKRSGAVGYPDRVAIEVYRSQDLSSWTRVCGEGMPCGHDENGDSERPIDFGTDARPFANNEEPLLLGWASAPRRFGGSGSVTVFSAPTDRLRTQWDASDLHPRVVADGQTAIVRPIKPPFVSSGGSASIPARLAAFPSYLDMVGAWTCVSKDAGGGAQTRVTATEWTSYVPSDPNSVKVPTKGLVLQLSEVAQVGDYAEASASSSMSVSEYGSVVLLMDLAESVEFFSIVAVDIVDEDGRRATVWDPYGGFPSIASLPVEGAANPCSYSSGIKAWTGVGPQYTMVVLPVASRIEAQSQLTDLTRIAGIRITLRTVVERSPGVAVQLLAVCASGAVPGGTSFALSYASTRTQTESPAVELPNGGGVPWTECGAALTFAFPVLETDAVGYSYRVRAALPDANDVRSGADTILLYGRPRGSSYAYVLPGCEKRIAEWSESAGEWVQGPDAPHPGYPLAVEDWSVPISVDALDYDPARVAPDEYVRECPSFQAACFAANRLWVGQGQTLYASDYGEPFRFREFVAFLDDGSVDMFSGVKHELPGERILAIHALDGPTLGTNRVAVFTDQNVYMFDGAQPSVPGNIVGALGACGPMAACIHRDQLHWIAAVGQARYWNNGGIGQPSDRVVENLFRSPDFRACVASDELRVWHSVRQPPYTEIALYRPDAGSWHMRTFPEQISGFVRHGRSIVGFGDDGSVWLLADEDAEWDTAGGVQKPIRAEIQTRMVGAGYTQGVAFTGCRLLCDPPLSLEVAITGLNGETRTNVSPLGGRGSVWVGGRLGASVADAAVGARVAADVKAGWRLFGVDVDMDLTGAASDAGP